MTKIHNENINMKDIITAFRQIKILGVKSVTMNINDMLIITRSMPKLFYLYTDYSIMGVKIEIADVQQSPKLPDIDKYDVDADIRPWSELTIDHGNITTDTETFRKFIDLCGNNKIKLNIINGNINIKGYN